MAAPQLPARIHLLGIGGAGVSGMARILHARGHRLSGHDRARTPLLDALDPLGIPVAIGASRAADVPEDAELVVRSAAVSVDDPQVARAVERGLPVLKYAEALPHLAPPERTLAVAGTHGKTSTAWLLHHAMRAVAEDGRVPTPGCLIGGLCRTLRTNAQPAAPDGPFTLEACEYDRSFLHLAPAAALVTNVDADHLDCFGDLEGVVRAFEAFAARIAPDGVLVLGETVPERVERAARCRSLRLGRDIDVVLAGDRSGCFSFALAGDVETCVVQLAVPGRFQVDNAAAALALATLSTSRQRSIEPVLAAAPACAGIPEFRGAARRFEPWGSAGGVDLVHDYAHHPTEVAATLEAAGRVFGQRPLVVLFQPHQHSRTAHFLAEFADALRRADGVVVADVYGARTHIDGEHSKGASDLVNELRRRHVDAREGGDLTHCVDVLLDTLPDGAAVLVLGAGDIEDVKDELLSKLAVRRPRGRAPRG